MNQKPNAPSKQIQKRIMEEEFQRQENEAIQDTETHYGRGISASGK